MNVYIRKDWRVLDLIPGLRLGDCVVSSSFPQLALKIIPTEEQAENAYVMAQLVVRPVIARFGKFVVSSWIRDYDLNKAVGGVGDSGHLIGASVDWQSPEAKGGMPAVFDFCLNDIEWPGELLYYKIRGHCHADKPRLGVWADRKAIDK